MFKYNKRSQVCGFIQNLLRSKNVPLVPILRDPEGLFNNEGIPKGFSYIHDGYFYLGQGVKNENNNVVALPPIRQSKYDFGKKYLNLTNTYIPTESYYSSELHEHLGEYLRAYRDTYKIDLMGLYNCFSGRLISRVSLPMSLRTEDTSVGDNSEKITSFTTWYEFKEANDNYKITCFPIKFNMKYRLKIYGKINGNVTLQPIFYYKGSYLRLEITNANNNSNPIIFNSTTAIYTNNIEYELNLDNEAKKINKENEVDLPTIKKYLIENEKYLYLFVQVPQSQDLQMSVIEEAEYFNVVNNSLLNLDVNYNVPFSDRLLEFLTNNVITPQDEIKQNITRIQTIIMSNDFKRAYYKELYKSALYAPYTDENSSEQEKLDAVLKGHYKKLKRFIQMNDEDKEYIPNNTTDSKTQGAKVSVPPSNIIIADDIPYSPTPGEYDDTMRVLLYSLFSTAKIGDGNQNIPDFTGYVDKDVENLLLKWVTSKALKDKLREV